MSDSRLFKILYYLLDRKLATAPELAAEFEVSQRTIYRDVEALSGAGIPIYAEPGRNGGICLPQDFILDRAGKFGSFMKTRTVNEAGGSSYCFMRLYTVGLMFKIFLTMPFALSVFLILQLYQRVILCNYTKKCLSLQ